MNAPYVHGGATLRLQDEQWQHAANEGHGRNWSGHPKEDARHRLNGDPGRPGRHENMPRHEWHEGNKGHNWESKESWKPIEDTTNQSKLSLHRRVPS